MGQVQRDIQGSELHSVITGDASFILGGLCSLESCSPAIVILLSCVSDWLS